MKEIRFNHCFPKYWEKEARYILPSGGSAMSNRCLEDILKVAKTTSASDKTAKLWMQMFDTDYRVDSQHLDWSKWNGVVFDDIDSKLYYNNVKEFNVKTLVEDLVDFCKDQYGDNFLGLQLSNSGTGIHMFWYFDCDKTEENFKKAKYFTTGWVKAAFKFAGAEHILNYRFGKQKVYDSCANSYFQGCYVTANDFIYGDVESADFGKCEIFESINIKQISQITQNDIPTFVNGKSVYEVERIDEVEPNNIEYMPHAMRRTIYEALMCVYADEKSVNEQWEYVCNLLPDGNGHDKAFYLKEPSKNQWYKRFNKETPHSVWILKNFGYVLKCKNEYIYIREYIKNWRAYITNTIKKYWEQSPKCQHITESLRKELEEWLSKNKKATKSDIDATITKYKIQMSEAFDESIKDITIWDDYWTLEEYNSYNDDEKELCDELSEKIDKCRKQYYRRKFDWKKHMSIILGKYYDEREKNTDAYKMYADLYYRDENNMSTLSYDVRDDMIMLENAWDRRLMKHTRTTFKTNDEFTHWKNFNTFTNKCSKELLRDSVSKFAAKNFPFDPVTNYLLSLVDHETDEEKYETFLIRHLGADDTPLTRQITRKFFIAAVKKQLYEGIFFFPHMLFLQGPTNNNKTMLLTTLFTVNGRQYIINKVDPNASDKEIGPLLDANWMVQFGESASLKRVDVNTVKEFVDRMNMVMKFQKKFENEQTTVYPRVVITRTSNEETLFNDVSVDEGDKRNWLVVCKAPAYSSTEENRQAIRDEKDLFWATAVKLYFENPEQDLELDGNLFEELNKVQEEFKLIKNDDIREKFELYFERDYFLNEAGMFVDETDFKVQSSRSIDYISEEIVKEKPLWSADPITQSKFGIYKKHFDRIPMKWISDAMSLSNNEKTKMWKYIAGQGWEMKVAKYNNLSMRCWCKKEK